MLPPEQRAGAGCHVELAEKGALDHARPATHELEQEDEEGFTIALATWTDSWTLRTDYPVTLGELYDMVDGLVHTADETAEQEFGANQ